MKNLYAIRFHRGLTQQELGNAAGIGKAYVSLLEQERFGGVEVALKVAEALDVDVRDLYQGEHRCAKCGVPSANVMIPGGDTCGRSCDEPVTAA